MFVRHTFFLMILCFQVSAQIKLADKQNAIDSDIERLTDKLEHYISQGHYDSLTMAYMESAYLLDRNLKLNGSDAIKQYWGDLNGNKLNFESVESSTEEAAIYEDQYYSSLQNKPPGWRINGIELDDDQDLIYQVGRMERNGVKAKSGAFIIVWKVEDVDTYGILLHSLVWW